MSADNSREFGNYYEDQFGDRIRGISSGGSAPKPPRQQPSSGGGSGKGRGGLGFLVLFVAIGLFRALASSGSRHSEPPMPQVKVPQLHRPANLDEANRLLAIMREQNKQPIFLPEGLQPPPLEKLFIEPRENEPGLPGQAEDDIPDPKPDR